MELAEKLIGSKEIYHSGIVSLKLDSVRLPNGKISNRAVINHPGSVCIAAITDDMKVAFVKQYRHAISKITTELPAGKLEYGEDPFESAKRELSEETGISGKDFFPLGNIYVSPGYTNEIIYLYTCKVEFIGKLKPDANEFIEPIFIKLDKAIDMIIENEINDSKTQLCLLKASKIFI